MDVNLERTYRIPPTKTIGMIITILEAYKDQEGIWGEWKEDCQYMGCKKIEYRECEGHSGNLPEI